MLDANWGEMMKSNWLYHHLSKGVLERKKYNKQYLRSEDFR